MQVNVCGKPRPNHTNSETVEILNSAGLRPGVTERFSPKILYLLRRTYGLEDHYTRLRSRGLLTLAEISELLGVHPSTVKAWALAGHISSHVYCAMPDQSDEKRVTPPRPRRQRYPQSQELRLS